MSRFFVSLEDDLVKRYAAERLKRVEHKLKPDEHGEIRHKEAGVIIEYAQTTIEGVGVSVRDYMFKLDDVLNEQRRIIYSIRDEAVDANATAILNNVLAMMRLALNETLDRHIDAELVPEEWATDALIEDYMYLTQQAPTWDDTVGDKDELKRALAPWIDGIVAMAQERIEGYPEVIAFARQQLLSHLDIRWTNHLTTMNALKEGIGLRSYGQEDPSRQFGKEGLEIFQETYLDIARDVTIQLCQLDLYFAQREEEGL